MNDFLVWSMLALVFVSCGESPAQTPIVTNLNQWHFRSVGDSIWTDANVPGTVTHDLFIQNKIPDPFVADNALKMQWISETDWEYETTFSIADSLLNKPNQQLQFDGIDTYADIYLNGQLILQADNAFRRWAVDVSKLLQPSNVLLLKIKNHRDVENRLKASEAFVPPTDDMSDDKQRRVYTRRAQYQYGWDWAPRLITPGIWRSVRLMSWDIAKIKHSTVEVTDLKDELASLALSFNLESKTNIDLTAEVYVNGELVETTILQKDAQKLTIPFQIESPKKWWPHNLGDPYLYDVCVQLKNKSVLAEEACFQKGLRTVELINEPDNNGESFYFKVNGVPVFMKGANYVPQDALLNAGSQEDYQAIIQNAVDANMNTLRVWGGGVYESDYFYQLCDQKGLMVWQDFMYSCAMYPGSDQFLDSAKKEAEDNVQRIGEHASVVLWCGNNESAEGWANWGWKSGKSEAQKAQIWQAYQKLFGQILPKAVADFGQGVPYWESSPKYGRGNVKYLTEGDAHDWFVWHDAYPFEHFEQKVPRFMSEFGFQSLPSASVVKYVNEGALDLNSASFGTHQKHPRGTELIKTYVSRDFPEPRNDHEKIYLSQLTQALGISKALVAHRSARPFNMGSLYWQFNDCWPSVSWSSIDHLGQWKALHHAAKHDFDNLLIAATVSKGSLSVKIVNDHLIPKSGNLQLELMSFTGEIIFSKTLPFTAKANASTFVSEFDLGVDGFDPRHTVGVLRFVDKQTLVYFDRPKNLALQTGSINVTINPVKGGFEAVLESAVLQKNVFVEAQYESSIFPNFIDLLPNQPTKIFINTKATAVPELSFLTLNQFKK